MCIFAELFLGYCLQYINFLSGIHCKQTSSSEFRVFSIVTFMNKVPRINGTTPCNLSLLHRY